MGLGLRPHRHAFGAPAIMLGLPNPLLVFVLFSLLAAAPFLLLKSYRAARGAKPTPPSARADSIVACV